MHMDRVVVMFTPPHYKVHGVSQLYLGRVDRAIKEAERQNCPLIVAGDANGGRDLFAFAQRAMEAGIYDVRMAFNGDNPAFKNTRGDARAIMGKIAHEFPHASHVIVVTCWYHVPRCLIALRRESGNWRFRWHVAPVWNHFWHGLCALPNELRGCLDYLLGRPQCTRGAPIGKPDLS